MKRGIIQSLAEKHHVDVICLEETHVKEDKSNRFDEAEWWSVPAPLCWWCCYCLADQLWVLIAYTRRIVSRVELRNSKEISWVPIIFFFICWSNESLWKSTVHLISRRHRHMKYDWLGLGRIWLAAAPRSHKYDWRRRRLRWLLLVIIILIINNPCTNFDFLSWVVVT